MSKIANEPRTSPWQLRFSLASVFLATAVVSMCLALARVHLGTGVIVSFLTVPALIRTMLVASREGQNGKPLSAIAKVLEFLFSWMLMLPIGLAAIVLGGIALTVVSFGVYVVMDFVVDMWPLSALRSPALAFLLRTYFFSTSFTAAVGTTGLFLAWGIRSSLEYRPVARI
ncbi:MAG: hypothetical protein ACKVP0_05000 [Pirellulaceae bacterium]